MRCTVHTRHGLLVQGVRMLPAIDIACPYCGQWITLLVDESAGAQQYIEDCQVCCRPIQVSVQVGVGVDEAGEPRVSVRAEDDV